MRILYLLHSYQNRGGTEEHTKTLIAHLPSKVSSFVVYPECDTMVLLQGDKEIQRFPSNLFEFPITPYRGPKTEESLKQILSMVQPDIVHIQHFFRWPLGVLDLLSTLVPKVVCSFHDYYSLTPDFTGQFHHSGEDLLSSEYATRVFGSDISSYLIRRRELLLRSFTHMQALIVPSDYLGRELSKEIHHSFHVIEHGVKSFERRERETSENFRFLYLGGILPQKGYESLLQAFETLQKSYPRIVLDMYGVAGRELPSLPSGVMYHGEYAQEQLPEIFSRCDVGIIPSLFPETFSLVSSEFQQAHIPIAASRIGALENRIHDGKDGKLYSPGDTEDLTRTLEWFLENDEWHLWKYPKPRLVEEMVVQYHELYCEMIRA